MRKQVVVIGLGRFGFSVAKALFEMGNDVLAVDMNEKAVQDVSPYVTHAVEADATSEEVLRGLGITNFDIAIVAMGSAVESSVMVTVLLKRLGVSYIIGRARNELHGAILEKIGADKVVYLEREMGTRVAHSLSSAGLQDYLEISPRLGISKIASPQHFWGRTLEELDLVSRGRYGVSVLAIKRQTGLTLTPTRFEKIQAGDILIVVGNDDQVERLITEKPYRRTEPAG